MRRKRTKNQLGVTPTRMPKTFTSWMGPARMPRPGWQVRAGAAMPAGRAGRRSGGDRHPAVDDRPEARAGREGPVREPAVPGEAGGAEGVGDGVRRVPEQQRGLPREGKVLDDPAGPELDRGR